MVRYWYLRFCKRDVCRRWAAEQDVGEWWWWWKKRMFVVFQVDAVSKADAMVT